MAGKQAKVIKPEIQTAVKAPNCLNPQKLMPKHMITKLLKIKKRINLESNNKEMILCPYGKNYLNESRFLIKNPEEQGEVALHFSSAEKKN